MSSLIFWYLICSSDSVFFFFLFICVTFLLFFLFSALTFLEPLFFVFSALTGCCGHKKESVVCLGVFNRSSGGKVACKGGRNTFF